MKKYTTKDVHPCGDCCYYGDCDSDSSDCEYAMTDQEVQERLKELNNEEPC